ncbi:MAG TPA: alpha/beta hydrolase [Candidatus Acidoferrales bacterium]|nr:alpha/beta hydrolase [Candidatus Acidoferrales bacterium]
MVTAETPPSRRALSEGLRAFSSVVQIRDVALALQPPSRILPRMEEPHFDGTVPPERTARVDSFGLQLNVHEWGDPQATPIVLTHGMWDHARSFDVFAPLLARRHRVVAIDARGHGDSQRAAHYGWFTDVLDIVNVLRWVGRPVYLVGHSKGGGQATDAARIAGDQVVKLVNIDGFGPPILAEPPPAAAGLTQFLDQRRSLREHWRPYPSLEDLVERRRAQNPRLSREWLRYFAFHGARRDSEGWRWKSDPHMAVGFGPWRPDWIAPSYAGVSMPMLAVVGSEHDTWGPLPEDLMAQRLAFVPRLQRFTIKNAGHFVHIEQPHETAAAVLEFLGL